MSLLYLSVLDFVSSEQQRRRLVCVSAQSDQSLCYSLSSKYKVCTRDDTSIHKGFFMRTKHLSVLIHIRNKAEVGTVNHVYAL